jgi:DNA-entry nuclease
MKRNKSTFIPLLLAITILISGCSQSGSSDTSTPSVSEVVISESSEIQSSEATLSESTVNQNESLTYPEESKPSSLPVSEAVHQPTATQAVTFELTNIPAYSGQPYVAVNNNTPFFNASELTTSSFETYSSLDNLSRCGVAYACIGEDIMPTEERGSIGQVKPTGWHTIKYDCVDGKYLYNRCHLIGYQLTAENANTQNLITGTRYLNVEGMLPFENMTADYIKETGNHVLYRVTPVYEGSNLLASGVLMEAMSVEDSGEGVLFNVYCYNVQPGVSIDYVTGDSWLVDEPVVETEPESTTVPEEITETPANTGTNYILNTNSKKFHIPSCSSVDQMSDKNKQEFFGTRDEVISMGYEPCGRCHP